MINKDDDDFRDGIFVDEDDPREIAAGIGALILVIFGFLSVLFAIFYSLKFVF